MDFNADPYLVGGATRFTPLHAASLLGARDLISLFLQCGHQPNIDHPADFGTAALALAASGCGCPEAGSAQRWRCCVGKDRRRILRVAHVHGRPSDCLFSGASWSELHCPKTHKCADGQVAKLLVERKATVNLQSQPMSAVMAAACRVGRAVCVMGCATSCSLGVCRGSSLGGFSWGYSE